MTISELTLKSSDVEPVRRFEVFTGAGRRRDWPAEEKARIVAESYETGETVRSVARRCALSPQQLFAWRRAARRAAAETRTSESLFVPAVVAAPTPEPAAKHPTRPRLGSLTSRIPIVRKGVPWMNRAGERAKLVHFSWLTIQIEPRRCEPSKLNPRLCQWSS